VAEKDESHLRSKKTRRKCEKLNAEGKNPEKKLKEKEGDYDRKGSVTSGRTLGGEGALRGKGDTKGSSGGGGARNLQ